VSPAARVWLLLCVAAVSACEPEQQPVADAGTKKDGGFVLVEDPDPETDAGEPDAGEQDAGTVKPDGGTPRPDAGVDAGTAGCGDGLLDPSEESCDDGNSAAGDGCSPTCSVETGFTCTPGGCTTTCGDGLRAGTEDCDDGNLLDGDGCTVSCTVQPGFTCSPGGECLTVCGDGMTVGSEGCDDQNVRNGDGCSAICTVETGYACTGATCTSVCGDGIVVTGAVDPSDNEACDDSNTSGGDGCSATCAFEPGFTCTATDGCRPVCGDGRTVGSETCDDQNLLSGDGCSDACLLEPGFACTGTACTSVCGDGIVVTGALVPSNDEACDDSNTTSGDGCSATCTVETGFTCSGEPSACSATCGDGVVAGTEGCDDQGTAAGDGCDPFCVAEPGYACLGSPSTCTTVCGDGRRAGSEGCDDGNNASGDGCESCVLTLGYSCSGEPSVCETVCGDGIRVAATEQCEPGVTPTAYGCASNCTLLGALQLQFTGAPVGSSVTVEGVSPGLSYSDVVTVSVQPALLTGLAPGTYSVTGRTERVRQDAVDELVDPPVAFQVQVTGGLKAQSQFTWPVRGGTGNLWVGNGAGSSLRGFSNAALGQAGATSTALLTASGTRFPAVVALPDGTLVFGGEASGAGALVTFSAASLFTGTAAVPQPAPAPTLALSLPTAGVSALSVDSSGAVWAAAGTEIFRVGQPAAGAAVAGLTLQDPQSALLAGTVSALAFTVASDGKDVLWVARSSPASLRGYKVTNAGPQPSATFAGELEVDPFWPTGLSGGAVLAVEEDRASLWAADVMMGQLRVQEWYVSSLDATAPTPANRAFLSSGWAAPVGLATGRENQVVDPPASPLFVADGSGKLLVFSAADLGGNHQSLTPTTWDAAGGAGLALSPPHP
jgi:cysteine-rich repeat protein